MKTKVVSRKPDARPGEELKPRLIAFEVTRRCRYECKHCRASAGAGHKYELSTQQCKKIVAAVAEFAKPILIVTGGEPMEREDIYEIMEYAHEQGLRVVMATCGYMIDAVSLKKLRKAGVSALSFSIDGASADSHDAFRQTNGAFDSIMKAAEMARKTKMPFQINTTISTLNAGEVIGIAELAKRIGASCWNPFLLVPTGRGEQIADAMLDPIEYESLLGELLRIKLKGDIQVRCTCAPQFARVCEQAKSRGLVAESTGCIGGKTFGFISWRGDVQTCGFLEVSAGNLVDNGYDFAKLWLESQFLSRIRNTVEYGGKCAECEYVGLCGGCKARAMAIHGDYLAGDPLCGYKPKGRK